MIKAFQDPEHKKIMRMFCNTGRTNHNYDSTSLIPWSRALLEKLPLTLLVKKFPVFYGSRWFITELK